MKKAYFISDLHLGASYHENSRELELGVVRFLDSIKDEAEEIFLLGDILDYWYEYRYVVPRGYVRFFGKLAELSDSGVKITWLIGNHDIWIFDYLPSELGVEVIDGVLEREVLGVPFCMQHGDAIGGNRYFRTMRALFRNKICQILYSGIHPRWTVGFAKAWSRHSRLGAKGEEYMPGKLITDIRHWCEVEIKGGNPARYYIFGHLHKFHNDTLPEGRRLIVMPDWLSGREYGVFDGSEFILKDYEEKA